MYTYLFYKFRKYVMLGVHFMFGSFWSCVCFAYDITLICLKGLF